MGLEWKDIDFENKTMRIARNSQYVKKKGTITKDTKTVKSRRVLDLPMVLIGLIKEYKEWQENRKQQLGDIWKHDTDRLFTRETGEPTNPDTISAWFHKFIRTTDLPHETTIHSLRHTYATLLISLGIPINAVSGNLGHSTTATTLNIYTHAIHSASREAANKLEEMLHK